MWSGVAFGLFLGIYLNVTAYRSRKSINSVKSSASIKGNISNDYEVIYLAYRADLKKGNKSNIDNNVFKGNLALKSEYEADDCLV